MITKSLKQYVFYFNVILILILCACGNPTQKNLPTAFSFSDYQRENSMVNERVGMSVAFVKNEDQNMDCGYCKNNVFYSSMENDGRGPVAEYIRSKKYTVLVLNDYKNWKKKFCLYYSDTINVPTFLLSKESDTLFTFKGTINWFCGIYDKYLFVEAINTGEIKIYNIEERKMVAEVNYFNSSSCYAKIGRWNADPSVKFDGTFLYFLQYLKGKANISTSGSYEATVEEVKINVMNLKKEKIKQLKVSIFPSRN